VGEKINQNDEIKITFDFQNPYALESTDISVLLLNQYNNHVLSSGKTTGGTFALAKSAEWDGTLSKVLGGWGVDLATSKLPFKIYRNGLTQKIYNNLRFRAGLKTEISKTVKMKVVISFLSTVIVQPSSFSCSFASSCTASSSSSSSTSSYYVINCDNIAGLKDISFNVKVSIANDAADTPKLLPVNFVTVEAFPYNEKGVLMDKSIVDNYFLSSINQPQPPLTFYNQLFLSPFRTTWTASTKQSRTITSPCTPFTRLLPPIP
jgi:hypothetical protein